MSGQPYINPLDPAKFRQQYLANLALTANINDYNLQSNQIYKRTGASAQPTDQRTTAEKQADVYRLRIEVRSKLSEIADGPNADKIVQQLDNDQLIFLSDQLPFIVADLKPKYRTGILAEIFIPYFEKYMDFYQKTKGVNAGLQQEAGEQILLNQEIIMGNMASKSDINDIDDAIRELGLANSNMGKAIRQNLANIELVLDYLPETMETLNEADNAITKGQIQSSLNDIVKDLPTKQELNDLIRQLAVAQGKMNVAGVEAILSRLVELTDAGADIRGELAVLNQIVEQAKREAPQQRIQQPIGRVESIETFRFVSPSGATFSYINPDNIAPSGRPNKSDLLNYVDIIADLIPNFYVAGQTPSKVKNSSKTSLKEFLKVKDAIIRSELERLMEAQGIQEAQVIPSEFQTPQKQGKGMSAKKIKIGRGIVRPPDRPNKRNDVLVPEYDVDYTQGIKPTPRFIPFGRFVINKERLNKDIIAIKRPAGGAILDLPSKRVSRNLGKILRNIVGGNTPSFDDINNLDSEEKEYLHLLASRSNLLDKINIPTPNKDADEADINKFEIMRGQIIAGNDSKDLIKNFKEIIIRMNKKGLIPTRQVKELLVSLAENGY